MKIQASTGMSGSMFEQVSLSQLIAKLAVLWIALLVLPFTERTLLGAKTYYFLYIGLGLVFVLYGLTIRSIFAFLRHARREPVYVWIAFLVWSVFICSILAVFAIEYDLLPHTPEPSIAHSRPLIDYLYYEIITFTTVGYGDIIPLTAQGKLLAMCTALLGATHSVTFVALVLLALTQRPPAKNQDDFERPPVRTFDGSGVRPRKRRVRFPSIHQRRWEPFKVQHLRKSCRHW